MNWIRNYLPSLIIAIGLIIAGEIFFRLFISDAEEVRKGYSKEVLGNIYGFENIEDYEIVLREQSKPWVYKPFVEYKEAPRHGEFVSVSEDNIRCLKNGESDCEIVGGNDVIWVFGGSTTFGYGVKNDETIPAFLADFFPSFNVINLGIASYYSTPERIYFENLLVLGMKPKFAVFIDGLNDFHYYKVPDASATSSCLTGSVEQNPLFNQIKDLVKKSMMITWLYRNTISVIKNCNGTIDRQTDQVLRKVEARLAANIKIREAIGKTFGINIVNVLQPVPTFGTGHQTSNVPENLINLGDHVNSGRGYEIIDVLQFKLIDDDFLDLSKLEIDGPMYVDTVHYTADFNRKIALEISKRISGD